MCMYICIHIYIYICLYIDLHIAPFAVHYQKICCSLTPTSNSLAQKYIHIIQSTFTGVDTQAFESKGIP